MKRIATGKRFVEEYLKDLNATQAAIRTGYSVKTARSQGQRLLTNVDIQEAIQDARRRLSERAEVTQVQVVQEFARIAFANIEEDDGYGSTQRNRVSPGLRYEILARDNHACQYCGATVATGAVLEVDHKQPASKGGQSIASNLITACRTCNRGKGDRVEPSVRIKVADKLRALENLGRHLGIYAPLQIDIRSLVIKAAVEAGVSPEAALHEAAKIIDGGLIDDSG